MKAVIPNIWNAATEAHYALLRLISRWQEGVNLHHIGDAQFEAFLADSRLRDWEKDELRAKTSFERTSYYSELQSWVRLRDANESLVKLNVATAQGTIFLTPDTYDRIELFAGKLRAAYNRFREAMVMGTDGDHIEDNIPVEDYRHDGDRDYRDLARYLRERYWNQDGST